MRKLSITLAASSIGAALVGLSGLVWAQAQNQTTQPSGSSTSPTQTMPSGTADTGQVNPSTSSGAVIDETNRSTSPDGMSTTQGSDSSRMNEGTTSAPSGSSSDRTGYSSDGYPSGDMSTSGRAPRADRN